MPKNLIVVGTPRSGTSLAASIFVRQGYFVANEADAELRDPDHYNPGGYWEAEPLIEANVSLFQRVGFPHHNTWKFDPIGTDQADAITTLGRTAEHSELVAQYEQNRPWVWKDPRLCYTIGYWWSLVDQDNTAVMLVRRDSMEIFRSFVRIGWCEDTEADREATFARMASHIAAAEEALRLHEIPYFDIHYSNYRNDPELVANLISEHCGLDLTVESLGFNERYSSSTVRGRLRVLAEKAVRLVPLPLRNGLRRVIPNSVLAKLFPGRDSR